MSKIREQLGDEQPAAQIQARPTGDLRPYVIFTQLKSGGPHIYAGWLDAADDEMAIIFAREHYGRDQECVNIWAVRRENVHGEEGAKLSTGITGPGGPPPTPPRAQGHEGAKGRASASFAVFTQKKPGDLHISAGRAEAANAEDAIEQARHTLRQAQNAHSIWTVAETDIIATQPDDVIWRMTDQTYRLARGYSRQVREKWATIRAEHDLVEYEKDDLTDAF